MEKFKEGDVVYHKATKKRCVVIEIQQENKTIKVRSEDDIERDYYPQELETLQEIEARNRSFVAELPKEDIYY